MSSEPNQNRTVTLCLTVEKDRVAAFLPLLSKGFMVKTKVGCSVRELLCGQLGLSGDYLEHRLQTIFLDGKAVDNVRAALVGQDSTLALSAAMPGLAGASLRRGGAYASMRHQITHAKNVKKEIVNDGTILLKLFNLVAGDIGPMFLIQGIWISGKSIQDFFRKVPDHFWAGCRAVEIDGMHKKVDQLAHIDWRQQQVFLKLKVK
jgi:hypothetical protein